MTRNELTRRFPKASEAFIRANSDHENSCAGTDSILECNPGNGSLGQIEGQEGATGKFLVRFESVRKRLCDPDNLSVKWLLDSLRYCKIIPGDEPDKIQLEVSQRKCEEGEPEATIITITFPL